MVNRALPRLPVFTFVLGVCFPLQAADRFAALSLIESGDNDRATGPHGEVSRYQMQPEVWKRYAPTNADWTKPEDSLLVAKAIMQERCAAFERSMKRPPTDFEFYVLWNAPAQVQKPSKAVTRRAERFCNVIKASEPPQEPAPTSSLQYPDCRPPPQSVCDKSSSRACGMRSAMISRTRFTQRWQRSSTMPSEVAIT